MIRILHILPCLDISGGTQSFLMNYYRQIDRTKIQFDFLPYKKTLKNSCAEEIIKMGGKIFEFPKLRLKNIFKLRKLLDNFFKEHKEYKIVHCHWASIAFLYLGSAKKNKIPARILHSHMSSAGDRILQIIKNTPFIALGKRTANINFACSKMAGDYLFKNKPYKIINNAIDVEKFSFNEQTREKAREELNLNDKFVIGHVGRFEVEKNHDFLIDIFNAVHKMLPNANLVLIGGGSLEQQIKDKVKNLGLLESVKFLGVRNDIDCLLQAMDLFLFPSFHEGLAVVAVEAQAVGLPAVFSTGVTAEAKIIDPVKFLSISQPAQTWAKEIIKFQELKRTNVDGNIKLMEFDIKENAKRLENYYIDLSNKIK